MHNLSMPAFAPSLPLALPRPALANRSLCPTLSFRPALRPRPLLRCATASPEDPPEQESDSSSSVDWDNDWNSFRASGMVSDAGPGRAPPSAQEKAVRNVAAQVERAQGALPTRQELFADWRFWVGIIVALSLFTAAVGGSQVQQVQQVAPVGSM